MEVLGLILLGLMVLAILLVALARLFFWLVVVVGLTLAKVLPMKFIMNSGHDRNGEKVRLYREAVTGRIVAAHGGRWCQVRVSIKPSDVSRLLGAV